MLTISLVLITSGLGTLALWLGEGIYILGQRESGSGEWTPGGEMEYRIAVDEYRENR